MFEGVVWRCASCATAMALSAVIDSCPGKNHPCAGKLGKPRAGRCRAVLTGCLLPRMTATATTVLRRLRHSAISGALILAAMKRSASKAALISQQSPFSSSVTLFSISQSGDPATASSSTSRRGTISPDVNATASSSLGVEEGSEDRLRRSKRVKRVHTTLEERDKAMVLTEVAETVIPESPLTIHRSPKNTQLKEEKSDTEQTVTSTKELPKVKGKRKASASPRKIKAIPQSLNAPHPAPERWRETYDAIKEMRSKITAPVDTMGCDLAQYKESEPQASLRIARFLYLSD